MTDLSPSLLREHIQAARRQHAAGAGSVLEILLRSAAVDASTLQRLLPQQAGVSVILDASQVQVDWSSWSQAQAQAARCVVVRAQNGALLAACLDPWNDVLLQKVTRQLGKPIQPAAATTAQLDDWLGQGDQPDTAQAYAAQSSAGNSTNSKASTDAIGQADGPIVGFVDTAIQAGFTQGASDIHFECDRSGVTVKHRLDGVMARFARMDDAQAAQEVISRIKVLAQLDITERRLPQDGRFRFGKGDSAIDLRVSIMPSVFGEDAVLRLLDKAQLRQREEAVSLGLLGFDAKNAERIRDLAAEPSGMLLVTGPTGSGKTTTVYAILSEINTGLEKIITIEDPVEYELPGVLQIPVNERKGLTFAKGLRSILRHDPDRILVGEIRDPETAEIAVQSALTGHLVFTTVHANSLTDIVGRFRHFGLDMFGFMSSLNGVIVQRLVRQLCSHCVGSRAPNERERDWLVRMGQAANSPLPQAVGCAHCHGSGYKGRFVVAEVHTVDDHLRDQVTEGAPLSVLKQHAQSQGVESLSVLSARHVVAARTSLEEIRRVVGWL